MREETVVLLTKEVLLDWVKQFIDMVSSPLSPSSASIDSSGGGDARRPRQQPKTSGRLHRSASSPLPLYHCRITCSTLSCDGRVLFFLWQAVSLGPLLPSASPSTAERRERERRGWTTSDHHNSTPHPHHLKDDDDDEDEAERNCSRSSQTVSLLRSSLRRLWVQQVEPLSSDEAWDTLLQELDHATAAATIPADYTHHHWCSSLHSPAELTPTEMDPTRQLAACREVLLRQWLPAVRRHGHVRPAMQILLLLYLLHSHHQQHPWWGGPSTPRGGGNNGDCYPSHPHSWLLRVEVQQQAVDPHLATCLYVLLHHCQARVRMPSPSSPFSIRAAVHLVVVQEERVTDERGGNGTNISSRSRSSSSTAPNNPIHRFIHHNNSSSGNSSADGRITPPKRTVEVVWRAACGSARREPPTEEEGDEEKALTRGSLPAVVSRDDVLQSRGGGGLGNSIRAGVPSRRLWSIHVRSYSERHNDDVAAGREGNGEEGEEDVASRTAVGKRKSRRSGSRRPISTGTTAAAGSVGPPLPFLSDTTIGIHVKEDHHSRATTTAAAIAVPLPRLSSVRLSVDARRRLDALVASQMDKAVLLEEEEGEVETPPPRVPASSKVCTDADGAGSLGRSPSWWSSNVSSSHSHTPAHHPPPSPRSQHHEHHWDPNVNREGRERESTPPHPRPSSSSSTSSSSRSSLSLTTRNNGCAGGPPPPPPALLASGLTSSSTTTGAAARLLGLSSSSSASLLSTSTMTSPFVTPIKTNAHHADTTSSFLHLSTLSATMMRKANTPLPSLGSSMLAEQEGDGEEAKTSTYVSDCEVMKRVEVTSNTEDGNQTHSPSPSCCSSSTAMANWVTSEEVRHELLGRPTPYTTLDIERRRSILEKYGIL